MKVTDHLFVRLKHIMLLMMTLVVVYGAVKTSTEADLREKLAASEMARAKALQGQAELSAIVKQLMAKSGQDSAKKGQAAQDAATAQTSATVLQTTQESTAATIQEAAAAAAAAV